MTEGDKDALDTLTDILTNFYVKKPPEYKEEHNGKWILINDFDALIDEAKAKINKLYISRAEVREAIKKWDLNYEIDPPSGLTLHYLPERISSELLKKLGL